VTRWATNSALLPLRNPPRASGLARIQVDDRINRKLAAILVADVVGYSRLMAADEAGTLAALKRYREMVFDPAVATHNGRVVKLIGDGTIVEFGSFVDALNCALSVQRSNGACRLKPWANRRLFCGSGSILAM
jgi:class 3 adenylate cyclase